MAHWHLAAQRWQGGQSTVEFSLVVVIFFTLVFGVFDLGRAVYFTHLLEHAAREGARAGVIPARTASAVCDAALRAAALPERPADATCAGAASASFGEALAVAVLDRGTAGAAGEPVRVEVRYAFRPVTPLIAAIVGSEVPLRATSSMVVEAP